MVGMQPVFVVQPLGNAKSVKTRHNPKTENRKQKTENRN
jgi:hypothetical protein